MPRPPVPAAPRELAVEQLTFGGDGLARDGGRIVFVPHTAPGDRVVAEVVERRPGYDRAQVTQVVVPGAARTMPGCRWYPTCGGCQWQHVAPGAQRDAKAAIVAEQLARTAGLRDAPVQATIASAADWGYRARITLVVEGRRAGYHRARSHQLLEIADCPIADPAISAHLDVARAWAASVRAPLTRLTIGVAPGGVVLSAQASGAPGALDLAASEALLAAHATVRGVVVTGAGVRQVAGDPTVVVPLEPGLTLEVPADAFTQVNPGANVRLVETVVAVAAAAPGTRVLDLYCGAGNFALPLARRGMTVAGVERDDVAVAAATANAARLRIPATFTRGAVADALAARPTGSVDLVALDPPRTGAADAIPALATLAAPHLVYVSCDPATLARDVRALAGRGYRLACAQPIDLFPQTYHVETVADLRLT
jgi:23S rRNA (uracil1939-C5)-methyltransferase